MALEDSLKRLRHLPSLDVGPAFASAQCPRRPQTHDCQVLRRLGPDLAAKQGLGMAQAWVQGGLRGLALYFGKHPRCNLVKAGLPNSVFKTEAFLSCFS